MALTTRRYLKDSAFWADLGGTYTHDWSSNARQVLSNNGYVPSPANYSYIDSLKLFLSDYLGTPLSTPLNGVGGMLDQLDAGNVEVSLDIIARYFVAGETNVSGSEVISHTGDPSRLPINGICPMFATNTVIDFGRRENCEIDDYALCFYVNFISLPYSALFQINHSNNAGFKGGITVNVESSAIKLYSRSNSNWDTILSHTITTGEWYKVVVYKTGTSISMNVDGYTYTTTAGSATVDFDSLGRVGVGAAWTGTLHNQFANAYIYGTVFSAYDEDLVNQFLYENPYKRTSKFVNNVLFYSPLESTSNGAGAREFDLSGGGSGLKSNFGTGNIYQSSNVPYSTLNEEGHTVAVSGMFYEESLTNAIPANEHIPKSLNGSSKSESYQISGQDNLQHKGRVSYPAKFTSVKVLKGNNSNLYATISGYNQVINDTETLTFSCYKTLDAGTGVVFDTRDGALNGGVVLFIQSSVIYLIIRVDTSNNRLITYTHSPTSDPRLIEAELQLTNPVLKIDGVVQSELSNTLTGTLSEINNSNTIYLLRDAVGTGAYYDSETISDFKITENSTTYEHIPLMSQSTSSEKGVYGNLTATFINVLTGDWVGVDICSFYREENKFNIDSGVYKLASQSDIGNDVDGTPLPSENYFRSDALIDLNPYNAPAMQNHETLLALSNNLGILEYGDESVGTEKKNISIFNKLPKGTLGLQQNLNMTGLYDEAWILAGQSNMMGFNAGPILINYTDKPDSRVLQYSRGEARSNYNEGNDKDIILAQDPMQHYSPPVDSVGMALAFGLERLKQDKKVKRILLIPCAMGSTGFSGNDWNKGDTLYEDMVTRSNEAIGLGYNLRGIIWHQGEDDTLTTPSANAYQTALTTMISDARADISGYTDGLIFVCGTMLSTWIGSDADRLTVDGIHRAIAGLVADADFVDLASYTNNYDSVHFSAESLRKIGVLYAQKAQEVLDA